MKSVQFFFLILLIVAGFMQSCEDKPKSRKKKQLSLKQLAELKKDIISGKFYQKDIPKKYGMSDGVYKRIIAEHGLRPKYLPIDRKIQKKRTKGKLLQIDPVNFDVIKEFESLEAVKHNESGSYKPEGIRHQIKKYKKAYGYYWSREDDLEETLKLIKTNTTNSK